MKTLFQIKVLHVTLALKIKRESTRVKELRFYPKCSMAIYGTRAENQYRQV